MIQKRVRPPVEEQFKTEGVVTIPIPAKRNVRGRSSKIDKAP